MITAVDPPFFQKRTTSSNEDSRLNVPPRQTPYGFVQPTGFRPTVTHSSSADDYRSVIDDLTVENQRLREELKRLRQFGPDTMRKEKLFEIKVHGLPSRKKRELEVTLRNFAASLGDSSEDVSRHRRSSKHTSRANFGEATSKHESASSSSNSRPGPIDSGYGSNSTGPNSSGTSLGTYTSRPSMTGREKSAEDNVNPHLSDIPNGLYPGMTRREMNDKDRKKMIVKKLEQLFTGKITGRHVQRAQSTPLAESDARQKMEALPTEPSREARIASPDAKQKHNRSREDLSASNSNGDQTESGPHGPGSGSGSGRATGSHNNSPTGAAPPEQRPTRPLDLDPDRVQIPSENMDYIRHLGLVPPELLADHHAKQPEMLSDGEGWVYINLLSNLAQLHIYNASPDFIRKAVTERSAKLQLSPDGRKIRWRGGTENTKFRSDSSGENSSQRSPTTDEDDGSDIKGQRKRRKTGVEASSSDPSTQNHSKLGPQLSGSSDSFHYKPLFVHQSSTDSYDSSGTQDSYQAEDSNGGNSKWLYSGSGSSPRKRRRADGAIVFYSGAPFCTDLSGDPGEVSPATHMMLAGKGQAVNEEDEAVARPVPQRTESGSYLRYRPLVDGELIDEGKDLDMKIVPELIADDDDDFTEGDSDFPWSDVQDDSKDTLIIPKLEACGVGRVFPEDHFIVVVTTSRLRLSGTNPRKLSFRHQNSNDTTITADSVVGQLATMSTSSPRPHSQLSISQPTITIKYLSAKIDRREPVPLPPPSCFYPQSDSDSEDEDEELESEEVKDENSECLSTTADKVISQEANPRESDKINSIADSDIADSEDDNQSEDSGLLGAQRRRPASLIRTRLACGRSRKSIGTDSSVATAGGDESGYSSSMEED